MAVEPGDGSPVCAPQPMTKGRPFNHASYKSPFLGAAHFAGSPLPSETNTNTDFFCKATTFLSAEYHLGWRSPGLCPTKPSEGPRAAGGREPMISHTIASKVPTVSPASRFTGLVKTVSARPLSRLRLTWENLSLEARQGNVG